MLIHFTNECKNKQEVVIRFIQKWIPPHDILNERVCSKFKHLRWVVAEDMDWRWKFVKHSTDRRTEKQEVDIGFIRKEIQLYDMLLERVHVLKLQESAMSVAKKTATKVHCRQTQADRYTWGQIKKYVWFWLPDLP